MTRKAGKMKKTKLAVEVRDSFGNMKLETFDDAGFMVGTNAQSEKITDVGAKVLVNEYHDTGVLSITKSDKEGRHHFIAAYARGEWKSARILEG